MIPTIHIPQAVQTIIETLNTNGHEAFIVGGCVRDSIMGLTPKDWDITTSALPVHVKEYFTNTHDTGIKHGTITVVMHRSSYEFTTYRIDGEYLDNRRPAEVYYTANLGEDLQRRDFTMNAIAYHKTMGYVDPCGGITDIQNKIIRGVGEPAKRFQEDALRMLRALRFSAQLDFNIEEQTYLALKENAALLKNISVERVRDEMTKLVTTGRSDKVALLSDSDLSTYIYPELTQYLNTHLKQIIPCLQLSQAYYKMDISQRLGLLFMFFSPEQVLTIMKYLRFDNKTLKLTVLYVKWISVEIPDDFYSIRKILSQIGSEALQNVLTLKMIIAKASAPVSEPDEKSLHLHNICEKLTAVLENHDCYSITSMAIDGDCLKELGVTNGKGIGEMLKYLLEQVLMNPQCNEKERLTYLVHEQLKRCSE